MKQKYTLSIVAIILNLLFVFAVGKTFALPGDIDPTFRSGGFVTSAFGGAAYASVVQADDKIVVVGTSSGNMGGTDFTLLRYNPDGTLDANFGAAGRVNTDLGSANDRPFAVVQQLDGKILVGGEFQNGSDFDYQFALVRYNSNGSLDSTFGTNGIVITPIGAGEDVIRSILLQPDGKIIAAGETHRYSSAPDQTVVVRYNPNGTLDASFGNGGFAISAVENSSLYFSGAALQTNGSIVIAATQLNNSTTDTSFAITRYNSNGTVDTSFGNGGQVLTQIRMGQENNAYDVAVQPDGRIIVVGEIYNDTINSTNDYDFALVRYNGDGSLDVSFGDGGKTTTSFGATKDTARKIVLQPDGKFIVAGASQGFNANGKGFAVARYNTDGSLDATFGNGGKTTALLLGGDYAYDVALQRDGKVVVVGTGDGSLQRFVAIRFTAYGVLDQSFNSGVPGLVKATLGETNTADDVIIQPDGKILAVGATSTYSLLDFSLARFNSDGTPDLTFGVGGKVTTSVSSSIDGALAVVLQSDGKIVAVGYSGYPGTTDVAIVRYNSDGTLDTSFGNNGIVVLARSGGTEAATGVVIQPDGKIVIGGYTNTSTTSVDFFLARFNPDGALDITFGTNGTVTTAVGSGDDFAKALLLQPDGKFIAAGTSRTGVKGNFAAVRYNGDGSLDTTFGTNGKVVTSIGSGNDDGNAAALQADGKIVVAGITTVGVSTNFALVRYLSNGMIDTSFGLGGKVITTVGNNSYAEDVTIQPNGKIIVVGEKLISPNSDIAVVRYNSTGLLDPTFGVGGIVITDSNNRRDNAKAVVSQGSDKIIVAGGSFGLSQSPPQGDLIVLRYLANNNTAFDFDGDGKADICVYRPSDGIWYLLNSTSGFTASQFGIPTDKVVPADYDGDGKTDIAVFRDGTWYIQRSRDGFTGITFGQSGDIPVPADFDGDGRAEVAVFRPSNGVWYIYNLTTNQFTAYQFGQAGDIPVVGDYDGDGKADVAVYRPSQGIWYLNRSQLGFTGVQFGAPTDKPVPADYDGDGKTDIAVFRPSNGTWYLQQSTNGFTGVQFGISTDLPVPADYDGDGKADVAVFRSGTWYLNRSTAGFTGVAFGASTDKPVPNAFIP